MTESKEEVHEQESAGLMEGKTSDVAMEDAKEEKEAVKEANTEEKSEEAKGKATEEAKEETTEGAKEEAKKEEAKEGAKTEEKKEGTSLAERAAAMAEAAMFNVCWDLRKTGTCKFGKLCRWSHTLPTMNPALMMGLVQKTKALDKGQQIVQSITGGPQVEFEEVEGLTVDRPDFVEPPPNLEGAMDGSKRMERHLVSDLDILQEELKNMPEDRRPAEYINGIAAGKPLMSRPREEQTNGSGAPSEPPRKKRRLITIDAQSLSNWNGDEEDLDLLPEEQEKVEKIDELLTKWGLEPHSPDHRGVRFVLEAIAYLDDMDKMLTSGYKPLTGYQSRESLADQVNTKLFSMRQVGGPPTAVCDALKTFCFKWGIDNEEVAVLKKFPYTTLRYVLHNYDGTCDFEELAEQANEEEEKTRTGAPPVELPGAPSIMRTIRLELIDPSSDALVVGDANLSFSMLLADHRVNMGHSGRVVATTFEDLATLKYRYKELARTMKSLLSNYAEVWHGVDGTRLGADPRFHGLEGSFGAVYYNFPHAGSVRGFFDSHPFVHWRHSNLLSLFFRAIRYFVKPGGFVKMASNANAKGCRAVDIIIAAERSEFMHVGTFAFNEWILHRYHRSFGDRRDERTRPDGDSYRAQQAAADMVYCFRFAPSGEELPSVPLKQPPLIQDFIDSVSVCACGYVCQKDSTKTEEVHFKPSGSHMLLGAKQKSESCLTLYKRFLSEASGVHIG